MRKWRAVCCRSHCLMPGEPLGLGRRGCVAQREGAGGRGHSLRVHTSVCCALGPGCVCASSLPSHRRPEASVATAGFMVLLPWGVSGPELGPLPSSYVVPRGTCPQDGHHSRPLPASGLRLGPGSEVSLWLETMAGVRSPSPAEGGGLSVAGVGSGCWRTDWDQGSVCGWGQGFIRIGAVDWLGLSPTVAPSPLVGPAGHQAGVWLPGAAPRAKSGSQPGQKCWEWVALVIARNRGVPSGPRSFPENAERKRHRETPAHPLLQAPFFPPFCSHLSPPSFSPALHLHFPSVHLSSFPLLFPPLIRSLRIRGLAVSKLRDRIQHLQVCWDAERGR